MLRLTSEESTRPDLESAKAAKKETIKRANQKAIAKLNGMLEAAVSLLLFSHAFLLISYFRGLYLRTEI